MKEEELRLDSFGAWWAENSADIPETGDAPLNYAVWKKCREAYIQGLEDAAKIAEERAAMWSDYQIGMPSSIKTCLHHWQEAAEIAALIRQQIDTTDGDKE